MAGRLMNERAISFGPFRLVPARRLLLEDERPAARQPGLRHLGQLVECAGELVGKDELIARVWPKLFVEESNLRIQVSALRRVLGDARRAISTSLPSLRAVTNLSPR
jgi:DNA-binding winged helix-turn-helix (wHTH) protein